MRSFFVSATIVCATFAGLAPSASAATITINASARSWMKETGAVNSINNPGGNYYAGLSGDILARNFFVFDLSGVTEPIVSASLVLDRGYVGALLSVDQMETYTLYDVTSPLDGVINGTGGNAAYTDLGSGKTYGSSTIAEGYVPRSLLTMTLNADGLADVQAALGTRFAIGGAVTSIEGTGAQAVFLNSAGRSLPTQLVLETAPAATPVPEPATVTMLGAGLAALVSRVRRRKI